MQHPKTVKVKPWGNGQGDFVIINEDELTDAHELYEAPVEAEGQGDDAEEKPKRKYTRRQG